MPETSLSRTNNPGGAGLRIQQGTMSTTGGDQNRFQYRSPQIQSPSQDSPAQPQHHFSPTQASVTSPRSSYPTADTDGYSSSPTVVFPPPILSFNSGGDEDSPRSPEILKLPLALYEGPLAPVPCHNSLHRYVSSSGQRYDPNGVPPVPIIYKITPTAAERKRIFGGKNM